MPKNPFASWSIQQVEAFNTKTATGRIAGQGDKGIHAPSRKMLASRQGLTPDAAKPTIIIKGQIRGGKNNMIVTRNGLHFPKPEWAKWRNEKVAEVKAQLPHLWKHPKGERVNLRLDYYAGDNRRRDQPAIIDSIFHVLEKAGFVDDDTNLWVVESSRGYDKDNPRAELTVLK